MAVIEPYAGAHIVSLFWGKLDEIRLGVIIQRTMNDAKINQFISRDK